jgi:hypothetical protein
LLALTSCRISDAPAWESIEDGSQIEMLELVASLSNTSDQTLYTFASITMVEVDPGSATLRVNCRIPSIETSLDAEIVRRLGILDTIPVKPRGKLRLPFRLRRFYYVGHDLPAIDVFGLQSMEISSAVARAPLRPKLKEDWRSVYTQTRDWGEPLHLSCRTTRFRAKEHEDHRRSP